MSTQNDAIDVLHYLATGEEREGYHLDPFYPARSLASRLPAQWEGFRDDMQVSEDDAQRYITAMLRSTLTLNLCSEGRLQVLGIIPGGFGARDAIALRVDDATWWLAATSADTAALQIDAKTLPLLPADALQQGHLQDVYESACELELDCFLRATPRAEPGESSTRKLLCVLSAPGDGTTELLVTIAPAVPGNHPAYLSINDDEFHRLALDTRERIRSGRTGSALVVDLRARGHDESAQLLQSEIERQDFVAGRIEAQIDRRILAALLGGPPRGDQLAILEKGVAVLPGVTDLSDEIALCFARPVSLSAERLREIDILNLFVRTAIGADLFSMGDRGLACYDGLWGNAAHLAHKSERGRRGEATVPVGELAIYRRFLRVFESIAKTLELQDVPLVLLKLEDLEAFVEQLSGVMRGSVIFSSQRDFRRQLLRNIVTTDFLLMVIDHNLRPEDFDLIKSYLQAHDVMLDDAARQKIDVAGEVPNPGHRMLVVFDIGIYNLFDATCTCFLHEFAHVDATLVTAE